MTLLLLQSGPGKAGGGGASAGVTWDPATITNVTLSGGNLVTTNTLGTTSGDQGARVITASAKTSGKYYFEATLTTFVGGNNMGIGIATTASTYTAMGNNATTGCECFYNSGSVYCNGAIQMSIGARVANEIIGIAVDLDNRTIWFRMSPSGIWNNSGTANPATNTEGRVIPTGTMIPMCTFGGNFGATGNVITANFGASSFSGAVPSGFTSGWPT